MIWFLRKRPTEFSGYVDCVEERRVSGWVCDRQRPRGRLTVEVYSAGRMIGATRADVFREDLLNSGIGDGCYGFSFALPEGGFPDETIAVKVSRADFWLLNSAGRARLDDANGSLMNSDRRGLALLRPGVSHRGVDESDVEIAAELQREWRENAAHASSRDFVGGRRTMWTDIVSSRHNALLDLLRDGQPRALAQYLVDLHKSPASAGLMQGDRAYGDFLSASPEGRRAAVAPFHDMLGSLAQYMGLARAECSEQQCAGETLATDSEELALKIEAALGHRIAPPTVFDGVYGLSVCDRILHGRDLQALYAGLRVIEASGVERPSVCEIGGGLGKVAHYAFLRGLRRYTIVDLPSVCAMQYFYLRRTLPDVAVRLRHPEELVADENGIDLVFASQLATSSRLHADILLNCDSFPEMGEQVCRSYFGLIGRWAPLFLSINQEGNQRVGDSDERQAVVSELLPDYRFKRLYRFRSWIRKGYVEELWRAPNPAEPKAQTDR